MLFFVSRRAVVLVDLDPQHLLRIIPLVQSCVGVEALVALQADEISVQSGCQNLGDLCLADTSLAFESLLDLADRLYHALHLAGFGGPLLSRQAVFRVARNSGERREYTEFG